MQKINLTEDYLECILILQKMNGYARSIDIARQLEVTKPTVCDMVRRLESKGMLYFGENKYIFLTDSGIEAAKKIHDKHVFVEAFLRNIGVSEENARKESAFIGNAIGEETYKCLEKLYTEETICLGK